MEKPWDVDLDVYRDEKSLLDGLKRGDRHACTCLLKFHAPALLRLSTQLMGDADEAEDVLQEAFIRACDAIDGFRGESGLGTWLHRIVINTALMRLRKRRAITGTEVDDALQQADSDWHSVADTGIEPDSAVVGAEIVDAIGQALRRLPPSLRIAFILRDVEELSTREAAEMLEISESALKVRLHRARLALRAELTPYLSGQQSLSERESGGER